MEAIYRIKKSRKHWKQKAVARQMLVAVLKALVSYQRRKIDQLRRRNEELEKKLAARPEVSTDASVPAPSKDPTRTLCVVLVLHAVISFRSAPRVLRILVSLGLLPTGTWVPHFTSVIHWVEGAVRKWLAAGVLLDLPHRVNSIQRFGVFGPAKCPFAPARSLKSQIQGSHFVING